jgi:phosphatidate cytidylyltransferase
LALVWLHALDPMLVLYLILLVAAADTGAYFAGRQFGRSKLAPEISPGKTREGCFGALFVVIPVGLLGAWLFGLAALDALVFGLLSIVVALVSVAGDLQESVLKREAGAKDSGTLLPGHGGVLDRIDSLTAAAPVFLFGLLWTVAAPGVCALDMGRERSHHPRFHRQHRRLHARCARPVSPSASRSTR